jgi:hypothetical protein
MADMKMLRNQREDRPRLSIGQYNANVHSARVTEYGADKYARGNYHGAPPEGVTPEQRGSEYIDAALRHLGKVAQAYNEALGTGGDVRAALALVDDEPSGGFPASMLPHLAHAIAGLKILVECLVHDGILPADPGQPWKRDPMYQAVLERRGRSTTQGLPQKDDPDVERRRVEKLVDEKAGPTFEPGKIRNEGMRL